ncbi:hypothetical protein VA7868_00231 [Vibrio aerogenes CECT 7868]|uniref:Addiction module antidote protein n=1 Tax=Vibrio aerogenes CECT 7868 TaxID=1216006 RepID=A0A1M5V0C2_9VIBR|nr:addiction module antidote protein [Vibrio aerogenes]SHH68584.1 hypothetical protein VA7868_00231 [Vibrio aerogenes CECT 7868]
MGEKTYPYNPFDFMETQEEINSFLCDCFYNEDSRVFIEALGYLVKKRGMTHVAKAAGLNRENLYRSLNGKTQPRWDTIHRVMHVLNLNIVSSR